MSTIGLELDPVRLVCMLHAQAHLQKNNRNLAGVIKRESMQ